MHEVPVRGFWSYVHADDDGDEGRILQLAADLQSEFAAITAGSLELFHDRTSLEWGDDWRARIDEAIAQAAFLIPIVTPRYFASQECRSELLAFASHARTAGVEDLVLPVYWIEVRELEHDPSVDEVVALVAARQRQDLRAVRLTDRSSSVYRQAIYRLASALAERSERLGTAVTVVPTLTSVTDDRSRADGGPGLVETLGEGEVALEAITPLMGEIGRQVETVTSLMTAATEDTDAAEARGQGFAARVSIAAKLADALKEPAGRIAHLGQQYVAMLMQADPAVRALIEARHAAQDQAAQDQETAQELVDAIRALVSGSEIAMEQLRQLVSAAEEVARMSSTMRPVLRELNRGLQAVLDGSGIFAEWNRLLEESR
jgi:hypothetical protein